MTYETRNISLDNGRPVLVTGIPRSGTTWVGRTIAQAHSLHYVHEPFNIGSRPCVCGVGIDKWFYYISRENEAGYRRHIEHTIDSSPNSFRARNMFSEVWATKRLRPAAEFIRSLRDTRVIVKDPLAVFSADWLSSTFNMKVVVLIRHPAAVVSSYQRLGWTHPFSHFLEQPLLMRDYLYPFERDISDYVNGEHDVIEQAAFLWKLVHHVLTEKRQSRKDWIFIRHEDLSVDPVNSFELLFELLDLAFPAQVRQAIRRTSENSNSIVSTDPYSISRNSKALTRQWKSDLSPEDIARIRMLVGDGAEAFYSDEDW